MIPQITSLPEVSFIDGKSLDDVQAEMVKDYQDKFRELTGKELSLRRADPETLKLYAASIQIYHMYLHIDMAGKMDLLKYAYGGFLDNLGANRGVSRLPASRAATTVRFSLAEPHGSVVTIPKGTRVSNGDILYFETDNQAEIPIGDTHVDVPCTCQEVGSEGNNLMAGSINLLVDPVAYVANAVNIDESTGGADVESDEDFADRIYLAPSRYSVAGPTDAYVYHTRSYSAAIGDVEVTSPVPGEVEVRFLLEDSSLPTDVLCDGVLGHLNARDIRPLTDHVSVLPPSVREFDIALTYYINRSDLDRAVSIQSMAAAAISRYIQWQTGKIGRDINPSMLTEMVVKAGAKRVDIHSPAFEVVPPGYVARIRSQAVTYGGIEND